MDTDKNGLKAEYEAYQQATWDKQLACMNYPEWLEQRFDELVQASDALIDEKDDQIYRLRNLLLWSQNVINSRGFLTSDQQRLVDEIKSALTDTEEPQYPSEDGHVGFYLATADGQPFHVLGDPNMSPETADALRKLVKAAYKAVDAGTIVPDEDNAPPDLPIALSDAEIELAEEEDRWFQAHYGDEADADE